MAPPFSKEQFFDVFAAYNTSAWPSQVVLTLLAVAIVVLVLGRRAGGGRVVPVALGVLWAWMGVAYHWVFFSDINPAAGIFGALFVVEGALFIWLAARREAVVFRPIPRSGSPVPRRSSRLACCCGSRARCRGPC